MIHQNIPEVPKKTLSRLLFKVQCCRASRPRGFSLWGVMVVLGLTWGCCHCGFKGTVRGGRDLAPRPMPAEGYYDYPTAEAGFRRCRDCVGLPVACCFAGLSQWR